MMKRFVRYLGVTFLFAVLLSCAETKVYEGPEKHITIGSGGVTGVYFPAAGAICKMVNRRRQEHGIRCHAESTGGSIYNINNIRFGDMDAAIAQSDWHYHAYNGTSRFNDQSPFTELRSIFSVHAEPITVITRDDSGVMDFTDLKGKRLNIGNPGSGTRATWEVLEEALGWRRSDLKLATTMKSSEVVKAMCDDKIDAHFWLVGHPSALTQNALKTCAAHLVNVTGPVFDKLVTDNSYYRKATIPAGMYNNRRDIDTFGVGGTFVTSTDLDVNTVFWIVKSVFDDFGKFKKLHPALANLKKSEMIKDSLTAPLHAGAEKYYREAGLL